ncbi:MAG: hypothetical protein P8Y36_06805, partial [Alphaproteobacteria bacterium]
MSETELIDVTQSASVNTGLSCFVFMTRFLGFPAEPEQVHSGVGRGDQIQHAGYCPFGASGEAPGKTAGGAAPEAGKAAGGSSPFTQPTPG